MNKVYIIWKKTILMIGDMDYNKSVHKVFSSKQEVEKYLQYAEIELALYTDEDGYLQRLYIYSLTEHELI